MGTYIHFTKEQKERANSVDLEEFLQMQGESLLPSGREKRLKSNHSITVRGNEWFDHATKEGGLAIDFVQSFYGLTFPDAVTMLLGEEQGEVYSIVKKKEEIRKPFELPPKNNEMRRVFAYLIKHRLIDRDVVSFYAKEKLIYESKEQSKDKIKEFHNAIFVGYDENGIPCHAHKRGIYTEGKSYKGNINSSNPCYSFHYFGISDRIYVFEAPIDMLSFITIHKDKDWKKHSYVALCGVSEQALFKMLEINPNLSHVSLCLDHDTAGIEASEKISDMLKEKNIGCNRLLSKQKDWNEDLKAVQNLTAIASEEHPQHLIKDEICSEILKIIKELEKIELKYEDVLKAFQKSQKTNVLQADAMKMASAGFLCLALREFKQLGITMTSEEIVQKMSEEFRAYQNKRKYYLTLSDVENELSTFKNQNGIISESDKALTSKKYEKIAMELLKSTIRLELEHQKQVQNPVFKMA
ncbi:MAG TPA: hypothetical protein DC000_04940 [Clostridiales bacterium]|nr:hypothetical protein [Clostridiales bacterium]